MRIRLPLGAAMACLLAVSSGAADLAPPLLLTTNGVIRNYTNFFDANRDLMVAALGEGFGGGGGTNAWKIQVNGTDVASPTIDSSSTVKAQAAGSSVTLTVQTNSIGTNELASATLSYLLNRGNQSGTMGWSFITGAPTTLSGYGITDAQGADTDLAAVAGLSSVGLITRTASGTAAARTITGDTEIAVSNGDGVAGNPTLSIGAAIARVAAIASGYQPLANILTRLSGIGLGTSGDVLIRDANGWTNLSKSTDGKVLKLASGLPAWGDDNTGGSGGGDVYTASNNVFAGTNTFQGPTTFATLIITNADILNPIPNRGVSNATPSRFAVFGADYRLTNDVAETGSGAPVRAVSPALTGSPTVPTASVGASNSLAATTEYVDRAVASVAGGATGGSSTNDRIWSWTADRFVPGTNSNTQAQYRILGDGVPAMEFDGSTSEEISAVGTWGASIGATSYAVLNFASDDTANTICWQVQLQSLTLRGLNTNAWTTAATWTSNVPGTALVPTNVIIPITSHPFSGSGTNDYGKPYMLRISRLPASDSSLSNCFLISVDHRFKP